MRPHRAGHRGAAAGEPPPRGIAQWTRGRAPFYAALGSARQTRPVPPEALAGCLLRWDGSRLTVQGEPHFAVHVWTREALAATLIRLATGSDDATDEEVTAAVRTVEVLAGPDLRTPFLLGAGAVAGLLLHRRLHWLGA